MLIPNVDRLNKSYATRENAIKAVEKTNLNDLRYLIAVREDGRFVPVFIGQEAAHRGAHFTFLVCA